MLVIYWDEKVIKEQLICGKLNLSIRKGILYSRGYKAVEDVSQKGCDFSTSGDFQNLTRQSSEKHPWHDPALSNRGLDQMISVGAFQIQFFCDLVTL